MIPPDLPDLAVKLLSKPEMNVLYIEGTNHGKDNSLRDVQVYGPLFRNGFNLRSLGGCSAVIAKTKETRTQQWATKVSVSGLLDRDNHSAEYIKKMERLGIYHLGVCEIENLLWAPEVLRLVCLSVGLFAATETSPSIDRSSSSSSSSSSSASAPALELAPAASSSASASPPSSAAPGTSDPMPAAVHEFYQQLFDLLREGKKDTSKSRSPYKAIVAGIVEHWKRYLRQGTDRDCFDYFSQSLPGGAIREDENIQRQPLAKVINDKLWNLSHELETLEGDQALEKAEEALQTLEKLTAQDEGQAKAKLTEWATALVDDIIEQRDVERALEHLSHKALVEEVNRFIRKKAGLGLEFDVRKTVVRMLETSAEMRHAILLRVPVELRDHKQRGSCLSTKILSLFRFRETEHTNLFVCRARDQRTIECAEAGAIPRRDCTVATSWFDVLAPCDRMCAFACRRWSFRSATTSQASP
jgi:hypothetical protein